MGISKIKAPGIKFFIIIILIFLTGCSSSFKDFKVSDVREDEGVVIGKVNVVYNNNPYDTDLCKFCIGSTCHELLNEGYVFMPLKRDEDHSAISLFCHYIGGQGDRTHIFNSTPLKIKPGVTYFGSLHFEVNEVSSNQVSVDMVLPEKTYTSGKYMFGVAGVLLLPDGEPIQVVGAVLSVKDDMPTVLNAYQKQVGNAEAQAEKSIISVELKARK